MKRDVDLLVRIVYDLNDEGKTCIISNATAEGIEEVLEGYIREAMGAGEDHSKAKELDVYTIDIGVDLSDDTFVISSDCGNKGLETGIVMTVFKNLKNIPVKSLGEERHGRQKK